MNLYKYLNEKKKFIGACDRIRRKSGGEEFWQDMMKNKKKISEKEFLKNVKIEQLLDDDETWKEWKESQADEIKYFKSKNIYFIQVAGFEFIFK